MAEHIQSDPTKEETSDRNRSTTEIEEDIRHTRQDMDETLDALEQKFSPGQLLDKMMHYFGDTPREYVDNLGRVLKQNPVPATLTGISLLWLMASTSSRTNGEFHTDADAGTSKTQKTKDKYHQVMEKVGETTESVKQFVSEKVDSTAQSARETSDALGEKGSSAYQTARHQASRAKGGIISLWHEQPIILAAAGLALGAAFGMGLPRTRKEDELMGDTSDRLKHEAEQTAREQVEKGKQVVQSAAEAAMNEASAEAQRQDMTDDPFPSDNEKEEARL